MQRSTGVGRAPEKGAMIPQGTAQHHLLLPEDAVCSGGLQEAEVPVFVGVATVANLPA